jgi:hypothetical protein
MFAECVIIRQSADADGGSIMRKAVLTTAQALFAAGAAGTLALAMLAAPTAARASSGGCTKSSPCSLAFTTDGQPAGTAVSTAVPPGVITSGFGSSGGPVKVEVLDASGQLVTNVKATVIVAITPTANPGSGKLSGTTTVNTSGGVASFADLSIDQPGIGYTLTATSRGMSPATSADFTMWGSLQHCSATPCSASASTKTTSGTVTTSSVTDTQVLGTSIGGVSNYSCGTTYKPLSDPLSFDVLDSTSGAPQQGAQFTVMLRIDKTVVQSSSHPGASTWQICYAAPATSPPFASQPNTSETATIGGVSFNTGLLTDCSTIPVAPCVQARTKDNAGDVLVTFLASGDPIGRG